MKTAMLAALVAATLGLAACAGNVTRDSGVAPLAQRDSNVDWARVARINEQALEAGYQIVWVRYPMKGQYHGRGSRVLDR